MRSGTRLKLAKKWKVQVENILWGNAILSRWKITDAKRIKLSLRTDQWALKKYFYLYSLPLINVDRVQLVNLGRHEPPGLGGTSTGDPGNQDSRFQGRISW
mgnify:CR=1 FL=1